MGYDKCHYESVDPRAPGMHFLRDPLECANLGLTMLDVEAGWTGKEHDHGIDDHEEVYLLLEGSGTLTVDGEEIQLLSGEAVRVDPGSTRQLHFDADSRMVVAGAP